MRALLHQRQQRRLNIFNVNIYVNDENCSLMKPRRFTQNGILLKKVTKIFHDVYSIKISPFI